MSKIFVTSLVIVLGSYSVDSWVINNIDIPKLKSQLLKDLAKLDNEISDDFASQRFSLIYPGTKWCGAGNVAENFDDLGFERETDMCCRAHDHCPDIILAGETNYNLTNEAFYTRLSCECDEMFRECLRATRKKASDNIGNVYFNALGTKCFRDDYPAVGCVRKGGWLKRKCLEYKYNTNETKRFQWFDVVDY